MSRKRWIKRILAGALTIGATGGCKQQVFLEPADYKDALMSTLPRGLENNPQDPIVPSPLGKIGKVATTMHPDLPPRMMTLQECIAIALEQGNTGQQNPNNFGFKNDVLNQFTGRSVTGSDSIRVFALDPATASAELERSLSKFDARWLNSVTWQKVDTPTPAQFLSFQNQRDSANLTSTLAKPLPTGGTAAITFSTDYSKFTNVGSTGFVNPNYTPQLQFTFEQPLLRLFGVEANQLSPNHPGSTVLNLQPSGGSGTEGILISRIRVDQQKAEFESRVNFMLVSVETAYWNLYAAYYNLYAQEEGLRQAFEGYRFIETRVITGTDPPQNLDQSRAQFEQFRGQVYSARGQVLESERQLRGMLGLRSDDGFRIVPIDLPNEVPYEPDFAEAANEANAFRPELLQARQDVKANQLNLLLQKNLRRPDLRTFGQYNIAGLGTRLDGAPGTPAAPGNALTNFGRDQFNSWTIGLRLDMPLGFRDANAQVREAQIGLARSYYQLKDSEEKAEEFLLQAYRRVYEKHMEIGPAREQRKSLQIYLGKVKVVIDIGRWDAAYFQNYLTVQQQLAVALAAEFRAVADYNSALAAFEYAKGTIQQYNNVSVSEGPLPPWVQKRAADHIRERTQSAIELKQRDLAPPPAGPAPQPISELGPAVGVGRLTELPPFAEKRQQLPELPPVDPKTGKPALPPMPIPGDMGTKPLPTMPPMQPTLPVPNPIPKMGMGSSSGSGAPAEDYFRPVGTVTSPSRIATVPLRTTPLSPATPAIPQPPFPGATGSVPLPVPPSGSSLPTPPPFLSGVDSSPVSGVPPVPSPPIGK